MPTATKPTRRKVSYGSYKDFLGEAERAVESQASTTGQWSVGQILEHLATTMDKSLEGFGFQAPWFFRWIGKTFIKGIVLRKGAQPGFKLPPKGAALLVAAEGTRADEALEHLRRSIRRIQNETQRFPHPAFGVMTRQEWDQLHLRHAELHMSFIAL